MLYAIRKFVLHVPCRLRIGAAAPSKTPCPNRLSAFEKAVRCFAENPAENVITPVLD